MVTVNSIIWGTIYAGAGIGGGMLADAYLSNVVQGSVPYFNNVASGAGHLLAGLGTIGGVVAGIYEAFFSPDANPPGGGAGANPNIPNAGPRINIRVINRGGRNRFRL